MRRLSVFTVTRNRCAMKWRMGCSASVGTAPVSTFDDGQSSSGIRLSRTYVASGPSLTTLPSATAMSSTRRTPCPMRWAPQYWSACQIEGVVGLHDGGGVREAREVERQRPRRCTRVEPPRELRGVSRGQSAITLISGQLDDRAGAQTSIEVVVEENFGSRTQRLERDH